MKRFLIHSLLFLGITGFSCLFVFLQADGSTDAFYVKFTTPKQSSMIIGSSRAAQGILPSILNKYLNIDIYNYAFSRVHTPFGESYLKSIKRKLNNTINKGVFILEVNPWSIISQTTNPNDSINFFETNSFINQVNIVDVNPNISYLLNSYNNRNIEILLRSKRETNFFVHNDGWCEVKLNSDDSISRRKRSLRTQKVYKKRINDYHGFSQTRLNYLNKTIEFLKQRGDVYLVRLPIDNWMLDIENNLLPDFDEKIKSLAKKNNIPYINYIFTSQCYSYTDGHHLDFDSGKRISEDIATYIINNKNDKF